MLVPRFYFDKVTEPKVLGHGYLTIPSSRARLGDEANLDICPECTILAPSKPVASLPDLIAAQVVRSGPCGYNARISIDHNQPSVNWRNLPLATYPAGNFIEVQWCLDHSVDNGETLSYRICRDQDLVNKFLDVSYLPTDAEKRAAEDCFLAGTLNCTDVSGQICDYNDNCTSDQSCYKDDYIDNSALGACYTSISGGYTVTKKIKIPDYVYAYTLTTPVAIVLNDVVTTTVEQTTELVGSIAELGNCDKNAAPALSAAQYTSANHLWTLTYTIIASSGVNLGERSQSLLHCTH
ncbi:starch binding domain-containing protein [Calycina marina]|uniref:Starch binding domain-containing protein n=1 Tax=Calycina marina TaxID=1763456 RepID=A0A9P8CGB2_9HELO|nr:starch binding domain-containing protein [Calycina marina]